MKTQFGRLALILTILLAPTRPARTELSFAYESSDEPTDTNNVLATVRHTNLSTFGHTSLNWSSDTFREFLTGCFKVQLEPIPYSKRHAAFELAKKNQPTLTTKDIPTDPQVWKDLAFFAGQASSPSQFLAQKLDHCTTEMGRVAWYMLLAHSTRDQSELARRQAIIKYLLAQPELLAQVRSNLAECSRQEACLQSFYDLHDGFAEILKQGNRISFWDAFGKSETALLFKSYFAHSARATELIMTCAAGAVMTMYGAACLFAPDSLLATIESHASAFYPGNYLTNRLWHTPHATGKTRRFVHATLAFSGAIASFMGLKWALANCANCFLLEWMLQTKLIAMRKFFTAIHSIQQTLTQHPELGRLMPELATLNQYFDHSTAPMACLELFQLLGTDTFQGEASYVAHKGRIIKGYKLLSENRDEFLPLLHATATIDAYAGAAELMRTNGEHFCFAQFEQSTHPQLMLENFFNPFLEPDQAVKNSVSFGLETPRCAIITGPNAGGKSTLIKAIGINVLLAQSLGIAAAREMKLTPFAYISSYLNIVDDLAKGNSLFKAEVLRAQEISNRIDQMPQGQFCFTIFDEVFNGTTPAEGAAAAYGLTQLLGAYPHAITLVATHFEHLVKLEASNATVFKNYKVSVELNPDGSIVYPFKFEAGHSTQHIALDILRNEGFKSSVIDFAKAALSGTLLLPVP